MADVTPTGSLEALINENARLRRLLDQQGTPSTLRHQVRNALGLMRSIVRRSTENKATVEDYAAHLEGRFDALLRVQSMVIASPEGAANLYALVANELTAHTIGEDGRAVIEGPDVRLSPRFAELLGLALHELVTNALKFGALRSPGGRIAVAWSRVDDAVPRIDFSWTEHGHAVADAGRITRGFGWEVIETMLPYAIGAETTIDVKPDGLRCRLVFPNPSPPV